MLRVKVLLELSTTSSDVAQLFFALELEFEEVVAVDPT